MALRLNPGDVAHVQKNGFRRDKMGFRRDIITQKTQRI